MARSDCGISRIFASTALSSSALAARGPRRAPAFSSWARSFIAARSSSVNPSYVSPVVVVLLADFLVSFIAGSSPACLDGDDPHARQPPATVASPKLIGPCLGETSEAETLQRDAVDRLRFLFDGPDE